MGRKTPRHRIFKREMLKPALRSAMSSRVDLTTTSHGGGGNCGRDKPLPGRPGSIVSSVIDVLRSRPSLPPENGHRDHQPQRHQRGPPSSFRRPVPGQATSHSPTDSVSQQAAEHHTSPQRTGGPQTSPDFPLIRARSFQAPSNAWPDQLSPISPLPPPAQTAPPRPSLRALFSSFSRNLNFDDAPFGGSGGGLSRRPHSPILLVPPAENLFAYLATIYLAEWREWPVPPGEGGSKRERGVMSKKNGAAGWEWYRRAEAAEGSRGMRALTSWGTLDRFWDRQIVDCKSQCEELGLIRQGVSKMSRPSRSIPKTGGESKSSRFLRKGIRRSNSTTRRRRVRRITVCSAG